MYEYQSSGHNFGEFGFVVPVIIGILQSIGLGVGAGVKWKGTKKYLSKTKKTQQLTYEARLALKREEARSKDILLTQKGKTELYRDERLKKLVIISIMTIIAITVIGLGTYAAFSLGGDDE